MPRSHYISLIFYRSNIHLKRSGIPPGLGAGILKDPAALAPLRTSRVRLLFEIPGSLVSSWDPASPSIRMYSGPPSYKPQIIID